MGKKSTEEKEKWYQDSIGSNNINKKSRKGIVRSKGEKDLVEELLKLNYNLETSFILKRDNRKYYCYDILLKDFNVIIEYNGDLYHANPKLYKEDDIINFPIKRKAKDIWNKDNEKRLFAESKGYNLIYIWESDYVNNKFRKEEFLKQIINEYDSKK